MLPEPTWFASSVNQSRIDRVHADSSENRPSLTALGRNQKSANGQKRTLQTNTSRASYTRIAA
jgi:hypothetical protein